MSEQIENALNHSANGNADGAEIVAAETEHAELTNRQSAAELDYASEYETPLRRPADARTAAFNPAAWLVDGATGLAEEVRHNDLGLSEEFWVHLYAARREGLLAARALVDSLLANTDAQLRKEQEHQERQERRGEIGIDF